MTFSRAAAAQGNRFATLVVVAGLASNALAVDYSADGNWAFTASHNDNIQMTENDKTAVDKYLLAPTLQLAASTETTKVGFTTLLYFNRYNKTEYDSDDQNIGFSLDHQFENSSIALDANLVRESTITSELETSGLVGQQADRTERYQLAPSWTYLLNDTNQIQLQATYSDQDYRNDNYTPYENTQANFSWFHILSERLKLIGSLSYSYYKPEYRYRDIPVNSFFIPEGVLGQEGVAYETKDKGAQVGIDYQWSEQSLLQAQVGMSRSKSQFRLKNEEAVCGIYGPEISEQLFGAICDKAESDDSQFTANLDWTWNNENHRIGVHGTKSTQPSSSGYTVDATVLSSNWNYRITEQDEVSALLTLRRNSEKGDSTVPNSIVADRDYGSLQVGYTRRITEKWSLNAGYQYNYQKFDSASFKASSNIVSLGVRYQPQAWHWSR